ncbi:helix-turn-helix domain-containing protein [Halobacteriovorax sp. YZS-1-1]|uniref:helix-turn-helix domain-containing protein n=1 Tax=unclassified Halobacteriovorax TaxID=2639665 RepID=UPI00399A3849
MEFSLVDRWLSVIEISKYIGVSKETIYRWLDANKIPAHRVGKQWKFKVGEVDEWIRRGQASDEAGI